MAALAFTKSKSIASHKANGAMKIVFGTLTFDTDYPDDGYTEAQLLALAGLAPYLTSNIFAIVPLGVTYVSGAESGYVPSWNFGLNTLQLFGGAASAVALAEAVTGIDALDGATCSVMIFGN